MDQAVILITGVLAITLSQLKDSRLTRWACVVGLSGQPFWIYATWVAGQWGIFINSLLYTAAWAYGFYNHWMRRE